MDSSQKNKNSSVWTNCFEHLPCEEAKAIVERLDEDILIQLEYDEARLAEELAIANEDELLLHHDKTEKSQSYKMSSKFYIKSLTLLLPILKMIDAGLCQTDIAKALNTNKSNVFYYIRKAKEHGFIKENIRDVFKPLELTQVGKKFVDQYSNPNNNVPTCRLENVRIKADVYEMPLLQSPDWKRVQMNNWVQYHSEVDKITVHLNDGKNPTIEFIPSPVDGDDPFQLYGVVMYDCTKAAEKLEHSIGMEIGRLDFSSRAEWVVYDPVANIFSRYCGQITVEGIGKINASKPSKRGALEFYDPRSAADYMTMPIRLHNVELCVGEIREGLNDIKDDFNGYKRALKAMESST